MNVFITFTRGVAIGILSLIGFFIALLLMYAMFGTVLFLLINYTFYFYGAIAILFILGSGIYEVVRKPKQRGKKE